MTCANPYQHTLLLRSNVSADQCGLLCRREPQCHAAEYSYRGRRCVLYNPVCRLERTIRSVELFVVTKPRRVPDPIPVADLRRQVQHSSLHHKRASRVVAAVLAGRDWATIRQKALQHNVTFPEGCAEALQRQPPQPAAGHSRLTAAWANTSAPPLAADPNMRVTVGERDLEAMGRHVYVSGRHRLVVFAFPHSGDSEWLRMFDRLWGHADYNSYAPQAPSAPFYRFGEPGRGRLLMRDLGVATATAIMNDKKWYRAVLFRDPADRLLSAWLDRFSEPYAYHYRVFGRSRKMTFSDLVARVSQRDASAPDGVGPATNIHWRAQMVMNHMYKFLHKMDFVGWASADHAKRLLSELKMWDKYGSKGWAAKPRDALQSSLGPPEFMGAGVSDEPRVRRKARDILTADAAAKIRGAYAIDYAAFEAVGLRPGGPPAQGWRWLPRVARCPGAVKSTGLPPTCAPGLPVPPECTKPFVAV